MYQVLVERDFKGKFKNTALGYFWHLLNPLSQIVIYLVIFTVIFGKDIPNYWVYISTGMFAYSFFSLCCNAGCNVIVSNANLVTKMTFAREILVFSKVSSNFITLFISYVLLLILILIFNVHIGASIVLLPVILILFAIFCTGLMFIFSSINTYYRDFSNAVGIVMSCMMFAVPIFYTAETMMGSPLLKTICEINPLFYFIECIHDVFYAGIWPSLFELFVCFISSIVIFIIGLTVFKKLEMGFAERL